MLFLSAMACCFRQGWVLVKDTSVRMVGWVLETGITTGSSGAGKWALKVVFGESDALSLQGWGEVPKW